MTKFTIALREIGTYKEVLRSQVMFSVSFVSQFYVIAAIFILMLYFSTPYSGKKSCIEYLSRDDFKTPIQYYPFLWGVLSNYCLDQLLFTLICSIWLLS